MIKINKQKGEKMKNFLTNLGNWPINIKDAIKNKELLVVSEKEVLNYIHGEDNNNKVSLYISNDTSHIGILTIPGGKHSDIESHHGDEVIWVLKGNLQIKSWNKEDKEEGVFQKCYSLKTNEKFLIPKEYRHQYFNLEKGTTKVLFAISPKL